MLCRILEVTVLALSQIEMELTESMVMGNVDAAIAILQGLKQLGVALSVDDFGTGYSSLSYLKDLPVDTLKIDRSFVAGLDVDGIDREIVAAICSLGGSPGLTLVAEGVETEAIADHLLAIGCVIQQGFHHHRPAPAADVTAVLAGRWNDACSTASVI